MVSVHGSGASRDTDCSTSSGNIAADPAPLAEQRRNNNRSSCPTILRVPSINRPVRKTRSGGGPWRWCRPSSRPARGGPSGGSLWTGRRPADVAEELGTTAAAVYQAKARVLRELRRQLSDLEEIA